MAVLAFGRWDVSGISVSDPGIKPYINLEPRIVPKTGARYARNRFHKSNVFIIERLMNKLMNTGNRAKKHKMSSSSFTGNMQTVYNIMIEVLEKIEKKTEKNPIEVVVKAVENASPREEVVAIEYGGARYPKAVECAPQRRVDLALRHLTQSAYHKSFQTKTSTADCLVDEIMFASNNSNNSNAISRKLELERQADASR